ncbi:HAD-IIB family hydrolase [Halomonas sp. M20]|uniref:HAD-IIB family hydrolase n=1 Tax=Halomonas sp. M20 TaxID=2763264 RepID=UPI001D0A3624|nr:HAD-IIB family hydrolase [Halomonas sp. M20]
MVILHIALQGCLRGKQVAYGLTADTGGHIRYLLELVEASAQDANIERIDIATRAFISDYSKDYDTHCEVIDAKTRILRFRTTCPGYLAKEALWTELPSFTEGLDAYIQSLDSKPDIIHAHYADAAEVAATIKQRHGIPFVFTAHSLGRVKLATFTHCDTAPTQEELDALERRITFEERALREADLIIASSRDEAEVQYASYTHYDPGKIRVVTPGSNLDAFQDAPTCDRVNRAINRFLVNPDNPPLLAIARPVTKKNLATLIKAYGESPELQEKANLVLIAGTRGDIRSLEPEIGHNLGEILYLIDKYDLYGKVAYPKQHESADIPAIYAYARMRRGVFVNPAFNEPFGLTLLEASAAGLPLIATESGGPNDIIKRCQNGILVDPHSTASIRKAALELLTSETAWQRHANGGARAINAFNWQSHVSQYHELLGRLCRRPEPQPGFDSFLITDIDNTLLGSPESAATFCRWRSGQVSLGFGVATGRSLHSALAILSMEGTPYPEVLITSVGSEVYFLADNATTYQRDNTWRTIIAEGWRRQEIVELLAQLPELTPQSPLEQRDFKLSYLTEGQPSLNERIRSLLQAQGLACTVIHSHGRYLDILPALASKGAAVEHVRQHYGLAREAIFVAGDSGNDVEMLQAMPCSIIVANFSDRLVSHPGLTHAYLAKSSYARGVIEGVTHFRKRRGGS